MSTTPKVKPELRRVLHSAYSFVRSVEVNKAIGSLTLDHIIQEQITKYKKGETRAILDSRGESLGNRVAYLDTLDSIEKELNGVIKAVKEAGNDQAKLQALGIFADDKETAS